MGWYDGEEGVGKGGECVRYGRGAVDRKVRERVGMAVRVCDVRHVEVGDGGW